MTKIVEKVKKNQRSSTQTAHIDKKYQNMFSRIPLYWLPYMATQNVKLRKMIAYVAMILMIASAYFILTTSIIVDLLGSTSIPLLVYVIPGQLYYYHSSKFVEGKDWNRVAAKLFSILGYILIVVYASILIFYTTR